MILERNYLLRLCVETVLAILHTAARKSHINNCVALLKLLCFQDGVEKYTEMPSGVMQAGGESCTHTLDS